MSVAPARSAAAVALLFALAWASPPAGAAADTVLVMPPGPSVTVTGAATTTVPNDRMHANVRIEAENANATTAAGEVNARMTKALARVKSVPGVEAKSAGYNTWQTWEKGRPSRWKVVQSLQLTSGDFAALASLLTRLQEEDSVLLSGLTFSVAPDTRRKAEDALTREAVRAWQQRAATAAEALGYASWRAGRVTVTTGDAVIAPRPEVMMRAQAAAAGAPPVAVEAGTTELTVTVNGDALLESFRTR